MRPGWFFLSSSAWSCSSATGDSGSSGKGRGSEGSEGESAGPALGMITVLPVFASGVVAVFTLRDPAKNISSQAIKANEPVMVLQVWPMLLYLRFLLRVDIFVSKTTYKSAWKKQKIRFHVLLALKFNKNKHCYIALYQLTYTHHHTQV